MLSPPSLYAAKQHTEHTDERNPELTGAEEVFGFGIFRFFDDVIDVLYAASVHRSLADDRLVVPERP